MSSAPQAKFVDVQPQDLPVLLSMMRHLAEQPPALPFDESGLRAPWEKFLIHPELGRAWLVQYREMTIGYVILTLGFSFEYRGVDSFIDELYIEPPWRPMGFGRERCGTLNRQGACWASMPCTSKSIEEMTPRSNCTGAPDTRIKAAI